MKEKKLNEQDEAFHQAAIVLKMLVALEKKKSFQSTKDIAKEVGISTIEMEEYLKNSDQVEHQKEGKKDFWKIKK